jgi:hypothetical protein
MPVGRKIKGAEIVNGFNRKKRGVTQADINRAKRVLAQQKKADPWADPTITDTTISSLPIDPLQEEILASADNPANQKSDLGSQQSPAPQPAPQPAPLKPPPTPPVQKDRFVEDDDDEEMKFAHQMIADVRSIYKKMRGKQKLEELMENDKEFMSIFKELMKVETALMLKKLGAKDGGVGEGAGFFVILKGLESEKPIVKAMMEETDIDIKQVERAMNPTAELLGDAEEINDKRSPGEIVKKAEIVETKVETPDDKVENVEAW